MSYYENQAWQAPARQQSWEQPPPPSRSGRAFESYVCVENPRSDKVARHKLYHTTRRPFCLWNPTRRYDTACSPHPSPDHSVRAPIHKFRGHRCFHTLQLTPYLRLNMLTNVIEVERALDNLVKSGKLFGMPSRRDSMPTAGAPRPFSEYGELHTCPREETVE